MWSVMICLALVAPSALCKSVQKSQRGEEDLGDIGALFTKREDAPAPILNGPSSRQMDQMDLSTLFGGSSGGNSPSEKLTSDRFVETLKAAAEETANRELGEKVKRAAGRRVVTCVYCDSRCEAQAEASGYSNANEYFQTAVDRMNAIVHEGLDADLSFELSFVLLPYSVTEMSWFFDYSATSSEELLTAINNKFWKDSGLYTMAEGNGCDVDFLAASPADPAWNYMGSVEGIANMFQLCQLSFSTIRMSANPVSLAKLMTHEFGHMLGLYHDGPLNTAFTSMESYFAPGAMLGECADQYAATAASCTAGNVGCPSGKCIMAATVDGEDYSDCSKAYYEMFNCLTVAMPTFYTDECTKN